MGALQDKPQETLVGALDSPLEKDSIPDGYSTLQLGVYRLISSEPLQSLGFSIHLPKIKGTDRIRAFLDVFPAVQWFLREIYTLGPFVLISYFVSEIAQSLAPTVQLYIFSLLLSTVSVCLSGLQDLSNTN